MPLTEITPEVLLAALERTKKRSGIVTADRVRQTAVQVFEFGKRKFKVTSNVARSLADWTKGEMPQKKHRPWIEAKEIPAFLDAVDAYPGYLTTKYAVYLLLLFFVRKQELIEAKWDEFDLDGAIWIVPATRMKMPTEQKANRSNGHEVPLSTQAIKILEEMRPYCFGSDYLFPSNSSVDKPMGHSTLNVMFKRMGYAGIFTPHGVRATASTILNEKGFRPDVIERQLAHVERSSVRRAYNHALHREERRGMMQAWADYIDEIRVAANEVGGGQ
jgi:integrase